MSVQQSVFNLNWQTQLWPNGCFIARSVISSTLNTPTLSGESSRTPSTPSSLDHSVSPEQFDFEPYQNQEEPSPPTLPVIPLLSSIPQTVLPPARRATMPGSTVDIFHGDSREGENAQNVLHAFRRKMCALATTDDQDIAKAFVDYLGASSTTDIWFKSLTPTTQESWAALEAEFITHWPRVTQAKRMEQEIKRELLSTLLTEKELGKKVKIGGVDIWSHITWADKITILVNEADITLKMTHIWQV